MSDAAWSEMTARMKPKNPILLVTRALIPE